MHAGKQGQAFKLILGSLGRIHPQSIRILTTIPWGIFQSFTESSSAVLGSRATPQRCRSCKAAGKLAHMSSRGR